MKELAEFLTVHRALGDASRVRALVLLSHGELCLCELVDVLGLATSTVSKHMTELHRAGLVRRRKQGRWQFYRLPTGSVPPHVRAVVRSLRALSEDPRIVADAKVLGKARKSKPGGVAGCSR